MAKYVNENFGRFLSEKDLKENTLKENAVPRNIDPVTILDHSLTKVVENRWETLADKELETVQSKSEMSLVQYAGYGQSLKKLQHRKTQRRNNIKSL